MPDLKLFSLRTTASKNLSTCLEKEHLTAPYCPTGEDPKRHWQGDRWGRLQSLRHRTEAWSCRWLQDQAGWCQWFCEQDRQFYLEIFNLVQSDSQATLYEVRRWKYLQWHNDKSLFKNGACIEITGKILSDSNTNIFKITHHLDLGSIYGEREMGHLFTMKVYHNFLCFGSIKG